MSTRARVIGQLLRPAAKRDIGGHGDPMGFMVLVEAAGDADIDWLAVELPLAIACSTCRFLSTDFNERTPCWTCVTDAQLPKWRPRMG